MKSSLLGLVTLINLKYDKYIEISLEEAIESDLASLIYSLIST